MGAGVGVSERVRVLGAAGVMVLFGALSACGGGDSHDTPPLEVTVSVDGVADTAHPLTAGGSATISVPSGATLVFNSEGEARWAPVATDSNFHVNSFSFTSKSLTVTSNAGGSLVVVFKDKADESKTATLTVNVAPKEFERVAVMDDESSEWAYVRVDRDNHTVIDDIRTQVALMDAAGNYSVGIETLTDGGSHYAATNYDALDRVTGIGTWGAPPQCTDDAPVVNVSYPLHVGKQWSGTSTRTCAGAKAYDQNYQRTIEAFERISVPAGPFDTLRIKSTVALSTTDANVPGGAYSYTRTCWWAVALGRNVKCQFDYAYPDGTPGSYSRSQTQTMTRAPTH